MIDIDEEGKASVYFRLNPPAKSVASGGREGVIIPLVDYLALVKVAISLEELRIMVIDWREEEEKVKGVGAGGV